MGIKSLATKDIAGSDTYVLPGTEEIYVRVCFESVNLGRWNRRLDRGELIDTG